MRSIKIKLFGITVLEFQDDSGENLIEALGQLIDAEEEPELDDGGFILSANTEYADPDPDLGRLILSPEEDPEDD